MIDFTSPSSRQIFQSAPVRTLIHIIAQAGENVANGKVLDESALLKLVKDRAHRDDQFVFMLTSFAIDRDFLTPKTAFQQAYAAKMVVQCAPTFNVTCDTAIKAFQKHILSIVKDRKYVTFTRLEGQNIISHSGFELIDSVLRDQSSNPSMDKLKTSTKSALLPALEAHKKIMPPMAMIVANNLLEAGHIEKHLVPAISDLLLQTAKEIFENKISTPAEYMHALKELHRFSDSLSFTDPLALKVACLWKEGHDHLCLKSKRSAYFAAREAGYGSNDGHLTLVSLAQDIADTHESPAGYPPRPGSTASKLVNRLHAPAA